MKIETVARLYNFAMTRLWGDEACYNACVSLGKAMADYILTKDQDRLNREALYAKKWILVATRNHVLPRR